jgi:hypothetical protein
MSDPIKIDEVVDWIKRLRGKLFTRFRNKVTWEKWVQLLGRQFQDLEEATQSILLLMDIDNCPGRNLDLVGRIVGQPRLGNDDDTYRLYLKARIAANKSTGSPEDIYDVFTVMLGATRRYRLARGEVKQFSLYVEYKALEALGSEAITRSQALVARYFLGVAKDAGDRAIVVWQEAADAEMFAFDTGGLGYEQGRYAGALQA